MAAIDFTLASHIGIVSGCDFEIILSGYGSYVLRAESAREAISWVEDLRKRRERRVVELERLKELAKQDQARSVSSKRTDHVLRKGTAGDGDRKAGRRKRSTLEFDRPSERTMSSEGPSSSVALDDEDEDDSLLDDYDDFDGKALNLCT